MRQNESYTIYASGARADTNSADIVNVGYAGGIFTFDVTATVSTATTPSFKIEGKVPGSTKYYRIATITSTANSGVHRVVVYPGVSTANASTVGVVAQEHVSQPLPHIFRIASTGTGSTGTITYSAGIDWLA